ncbi:hypothetical protein TTHERM_00024150 (macronuclear) [Tetrahymena thermophila SB210]|uniref:Uncharacterized protein n=1 Tax=Tetrahymena thermophila (strain SB210) TaxID=312017 RepID=Q22R66_TETTS|nr:hypothetical protein TTHERM_00024150 [Tetrahymena thermophila SB210]EAR88256.1 hypothetical protein TTHERM_00024150 [Tetrahymena thermophila SB210]|eukprot:XP_001008501.1 hypothetical protein TTHERM_00024150 [Tetrahymena thermophila SB210]
MSSSFLNNNDDNENSLVTKIAKRSLEFQDKLNEYNDFIKKNNDKNILESSKNLIHNIFNFSSKLTDILSQVNAFLKRQDVQCAFHILRELTQIDLILEESDYDEFEIEIQRAQESNLIKQLFTQIKFIEYFINNIESSSLFVKLQKQTNNDNLIEKLFKKIITLDSLYPLYCELGVSEQVTIGDLNKTYELKYQDLQQLLKQTKNKNIKKQYELKSFQLTFCYLLVKEDIEVRDKNQQSNKKEDIVS